MALRTLTIVFGDQLDPNASCFDEFDASCDIVWMAEVVEESRHVWSSKQRTAFFLSAMRHFAADLDKRGIPLRYVRLTDEGNRGSLHEQLRHDIISLRPERIVCTEPGEWRVLAMLKDVAQETGVVLEVRPDRHFLCTVEDFAEYAHGRTSLRMEYFYRELRRRYNVLMDEDQPCGGKWNYDEDNRESFGKTRPQNVPRPFLVPPDSITREVFEVVEEHFPDNPGSLNTFKWPVNRDQALQALDSFVRERLPQFGRYQDAMWFDEPWLWHSHVSALLNVKLLDPREVIEAAEAAYRDGSAPLSSVEGFIRQILGWREYVRGIYWTKMPAYEHVNELDAKEPLPEWFWTGNTEMQCMRDVITQTLTYGYAHHIQRLMVTGLYSLLLGVKPHEVHQWYLAVYVDAVEWAELPNVIGMSQYADGGLLASKPYVATGQYIKRMSPYCGTCQYDPTKRVGDTACPFTTLYWDFLMRHEERLARNPRMSLQVKNLHRLNADERRAIHERSEWIRRGGM